jgi:hypothetical protein
LWGVIIWILPSIDSMIVRELREKKRNSHLITSCTYIIQQYTFMYLKITRLSTKRSFIEIINTTKLNTDKKYRSLICYKSWSATWQNVEMLFLIEPPAFLNECCFIEKWMISLCTTSCLMASEFLLHSVSRCHDIKHFEIDHWIIFLYDYDFKASIKTSNCFLYK